MASQLRIVEKEPRFDGNYSRVYFGLFKDEPAVKVLRVPGGTSLKAMRRKANREHAICAAVQHPNIVPLIAFVEDEERFGDYGALIYPWYDNGNLRNFLDQNGSQLSFEARLDLWLGVAEGVRYLHAVDTPIIHGDLKPTNVLIDNQGCPRICDFGLSHLIVEGGSDYTTTSEHTGTDRYLAHELGIGTIIHPTKQSDIWALGCLGLEIIMLSQPYARHRNRVAIIRDIINRIPPAQWNQDVATAPPWVERLIESTWRLDPNHRPSVTQICQEIECYVTTLMTLNTAIYCIESTLPDIVMEPHTDSQSDLDDSATVLEIETVENGEIDSSMRSALPVDHSGPSPRLYRPHSRTTPIVSISQSEGGTEGLDPQRAAVPTVVWAALAAEALITSKSNEVVRSAPAPKDMKNHGYGPSIDTQAPLARPNDNDISTISRINDAIPETGSETSYRIAAPTVSWTALAAEALVTSKSNEVVPSAPAPNNMENHAYGPLAQPNDPRSVINNFNSRVPHGYPRITFSIETHGPEHRRDYRCSYWWGYQFIAHGDWGRSVPQAKLSAAGRVVEWLQYQYRGREPPASTFDRHHIQPRL